MGSVSMKVTQDPDTYSLPALPRVGKMGCRDNREAPAAYEARSQGEGGTTSDDRRETAFALMKPRPLGTGTRCICSFLALLI